MKKDFQGDIAELDKAITLDLANPKSRYNKDILGYSEESNQEQLSGEGADKQALGSLDFLIYLRPTQEVYFNAHLAHL
ncbi:MAG: hypothetical protein SFT91_02185 [Rickettsiaceae bacterium]|nr:hypothetical protein [Rickettsiaceae bacterium]